MSSDAVFWVRVARDRDGIDGAIAPPTDFKKTVLHEASQPEEGRHKGRISRTTELRGRRIASRVGTSASGGAERDKRERCVGKAV